MKKKTLEEYIGEAILKNLAKMPDFDTGDKLPRLIKASHYYVETLETVHRIECLSKDGVLVEATISVEDSDKFI